MSKQNNPFLNGDIVIDPYGYKPKQYKSFIDDKEKMKDFYILSKEEFLKSYSYLNEIEYDLTKSEVAQ